MKRLTAVVLLVAWLSMASVSPAQIVADGGFEQGRPNPDWTESSTNFGSPICSIQSCTGFFGGAFQGQWWAWFGGATQLEIGSLSQPVTIPIGTATLSFRLDITAASGNGVDILSVSLDGTIVFTALESDMAAYHPWTKVLIDVSAFADGGSHLLSLDSNTTGPFRTNFFVDAVDITVEPAVLLGDMNCDGTLDPADIDPFVLALLDPAGYAVAFPNCDPNNADLNGDGSNDGADIQPFVTALLQ